MKNFKIAILSLLLIGTVNSCRDENFGDKYNQNKHGLYSASYASLLSGAIINFSSSAGGTYVINPVLYSQYQSQLVYTTESRYGFRQGAWSGYYANQLRNLNKIIADYSNNPTSDMVQFGSAQNMIGVSKIFRAIIMKRVTDAFGDAPFKEAALAGEIKSTPVYDTQQSIYEQIFKDLKEGRDMIGVGQVPTGDVLYDGNMTKWKKLANSVILQSALQLSKKYPSASGMAAAEFKAALANGAGVIEKISDEAWFTYSSASLVSNPLNAYRAADYSMSAEVTESMKGAANVYNRTSNHTEDHRLEVYSNAGMTGTGIPYGYSSANLPAYGSDGTKISANFNSPDSPLALMTSSYTYLNRAEAAARGWTSEVAADMLMKGIVNSYESLDANYKTAIKSYATAYATARVADASTNMQKVIGEEKWVSLFMNGHYAWAEWRRTGYPNLLPAPDALNNKTIPMRIPYPEEEANYNKANYDAALKSLTPAEDQNYSKFWWEL